MKRLAEALGLARLLRGMRRFGRHDGGVSALEFALFAPAMFILLLGIIELGLNLMVDASVQYAAQQASRAGITTVAPSTGTRDQAAAQIVNTILKPWVNMGGTVTVTLVDYGTFGNATPASGSGGLGDVVSYNISLSMPKGFTGLLGFFGVTPIVYSRYYLVQNEK
ncbi:TadE/TadG family type IV pilus assembly protein [Burkholderia sp. Ac-20379]|uniref:TadE/TadG family type IV pilus assembly protein n=1 Tax=Burkholderia sp. Ac-20379 TaxID=2703900 RepID=UPI001F11E62F|nr:TadE/TadG family type IV pilus assembly protein [Burkholderia sp. Ac-20379]